VFLKSQNKIIVTYFNFICSFTFEIDIQLKALTSSQIIQGKHEELRSGFTGVNYSNFLLLSL